MTVTAAGKFAGVTTASNLAAISLTLTLRATTSEELSKASADVGAGAGAGAADDSGVGEATTLV